MTTYSTGVQHDLPVPEVNLLRSEGWTHIRLYRATSYTGTASLVTTIALVADQVVYAYDDDAGSASDYYEMAWYNTNTATEGSRSKRWPAYATPGVQFVELVRRAGERLECYGHPATDYTPGGVSGTISIGHATAPIAAAFVNSIAMDDAWRGWRIRWVSGTGVINTESLVASFLRASGTFTPTPAPVATVPTGATFELWAHNGGDWWREQGRRALRSAEVFVPFEWEFCAPSSGIARVFPLPYFMTSREMVQRIYLRDGNDPDEYTYNVVSGARLLAQDGGGLSLWFPATPAQARVYTIRGLRHPEQPVSDSHVYQFTEPVQELVICAIALYAAQALALRGGGQQQSKAWADTAKVLSAEYRERAAELSMWTTSGPVHSSGMVRVGGGYTDDMPVRSRYYV